MQRLIYKICSASLWAQAQRAGVFHGAPVDLADGYIHFSVADQLAQTASKHFAGQSDLVLLAVATETFGPALRWEPSRGGALFPHLYAPLPLAAVQWIKPLTLDPGGRFVLPELD